MKKLILFIVIFILLILFCIAEWKSNKLVKSNRSLQQIRALQEKANTGLVDWLWNWLSWSKYQNHCFGVWLWISKAESQMGNTSNNYFGITNNKDKSIGKFIKLCTTFYYKQEKYNKGYMFYGNQITKKSAPTRYCMSENHINWKTVHWYCPDGENNFNSIYPRYAKKFINVKDNKSEKYVNNPKQPPKIYKKIKK